MKIIFAGTPDFAALALEALIAAGHDIARVLTQPDRPAGRGMKLKPSPVKRVALAHALPVDQPLTLRDEAAQARLAAVQADVMVVAAYGLILPKVVLDMPRLGCVNIHASLLPRWRGAAPIQRAIEAGDPETGITLMQMDAGLDTGDILWMHALPIGPTETAGSLHDRLAALGASAIVDLMPHLGQGTLTPTPQPAEGVTYAAKIGKAEAAIDWSRPAQEVARHIHAFNPFPGAATLLHGEPLKIWRVQCVPGEGRPGEVLAADEALRVACGREALEILEVQRAGASRMAIRAFLSGHPMDAGETLGHAHPLD